MPRTQLAATAVCHPLPPSPINCTRSCFCGICVVLSARPRPGRCHAVDDLPCRVAPADHGAAAVPVGAARPARGRTVVTVVAHRIPLAALFEHGLLAGFFPRAGSTGSYSTNILEASIYYIEIHDMIRFGRGFSVGASICIWRLAGRSDIFLLTC